MSSPTPSSRRAIFQSDSDAEREPRLDLVEYWRCIVKRKIPIAGFGLLAALLAAIVVFAMTPVYRSTATVLIEANKSKVLTIEDVYSGVSQNREYFQTQVEIIKSREVAIKAILRARLWEAPEFDPRRQKASWFGEMLRDFGFAEASQPEWSDATLAEAVYPAFTRSLTVEPIRLSQLARISFDAHDPQLAARLANLIADVYIENDLDARYRMTKQANGWLQERLSALKDKLDESERALQGYRERQGLVDVKGAAQAGAAKQIEEVTQRLIETRLRRAEAENAYNQIKGATSEADLSSLPAVIRNPVVGEARKQLAEAERRLAELAQRYGAEHPKYLQAEGDVRSARDNLRRQVDTVVAGMTREYEVARGTERTLEGVMASARGTVRNINRKEFELSVLEREVDANRQMYDMFMRRAKETSASSDLQSAVARVVDPAATSDLPIKPRKTQIVVLAFVFGVFFAILVALLLERLDDTLKSSEDVESRLGQPLLAALPLLATGQGGAAARTFAEQPHSQYAEAVRTARTGVLLSAIDQNERLLLVTSSLPGEGKTTFSINLALACAQTKRTLLIDGDLRKPTVARSLGLAAGAAGLSNLVAGAAPLADCLHGVPDSALQVLPAGSPPPNPLELLHSHKFRETLAALAERFELVIIDSPPLQLVSDALVISPATTGVIYVAQAANTPCPLVRKGIQRLRRNGATLLGVVLNRLDFAKAERYYGEYAGYGKYGDRAYGAAEETPPAAAPAAGRLRRLAGWRR